MNEASTSADKDAEDQMFRRLRKFRNDTWKASSNKHDLAVNMISACILEGINTRLRIVRALKSIKMNGQHVAMILNEGTGPDPSRHRWMVQDDETYSLHDDPS